MRRKQPKPDGFDEFIGLFLFFGPATIVAAAGIVAHFVAHGLH